MIKISVWSLSWETRSPGAAITFAVRETSESANNFFIKIGSNKTDSKSLQNTCKAGEKVGGEKRNLQSFASTHS